MSRQILDISGHKFGRLTAIEFSHIKNGKSYWTFDCACGNLHKATTSDVRRKVGGTKSCGCLKSEVTKARNTTHGMYNTPTHISWRGMKERCTNPHHKDYKHYGFRGIRVCTRWLGKAGFNNFLVDMGERPEKMSIDRINVAGHYEPTNCKWSTQKEQTSNTRRNVFVNFNGKDVTTSEFARLHNLSPGALRSRMDKRNISAEEAVEVLHDKYNGFTVQQIATLVGCGVTTIHLHVSNKFPSPKFGAAIDKVIAEAQST